MSDYLEGLRVKLAEGIIEHPKRWSGDTHDDLGGSADYLQTERMMDAAADAIAALIEAREAIIHLNALRTWESDTEAGIKAKAALEVEAERLATSTLARIDSLGRTDSDG